MRKIGFLGAGQWAKALARLINNRFLEVKLWSKDIRISFKRKNLFFLKNIKDVFDVDILVLGVPTFALREVLSFSKPFYRGQPVLGLSKGVEKKTGFLSHQIVRNVLGKVKYAHLSGPSFAKEIKHGFKTCVSLALNPQDKKYFKEFFNLENLKIKVSNDLIGVELGGAFKNVIAILAGISDGLGFGHNFRSVLIMEGFKEMIKLGKKMGAKKETFLELSGLGDLILTATSLKSRNYRYGFFLAKKIKDLKGRTIEGKDSVDGFLVLAKKYKLDLPIVNGVYEIIYKKKACQKVLREIFKIFV